jgi:hypothetical protein
MTIDGHRARSLQNKEPFDAAGKGHLARIDPVMCSGIAETEKSGPASILIRSAGLRLKLRGEA